MPRQPRAPQRSGTIPGPEPRGRRPAPAHPTPFPSGATPLPQRWCAGCGATRGRRRILAGLPQPRRAARSRPCRPAAARVPAWPPQPAPAGAGRQGGPAQPAVHPGDRCRLTPLSTRPCATRAVANRYAVALGIPVAETRPARLKGPFAARLSRTETALPSELAPCRLSPISR